MLDSFNQLSYFQFSFFLTLSNFYSESRTPSPDRSGYPTAKPRTARYEPGAAERGVIAESRFPATKKSAQKILNGFVYLETFETL